MVSSRSDHPYDDLDPITGPPHRDLYATPRDERRSAGGAQSPVVPQSSVTGGSLTMVIAIMCFLACLTAGAVYMINQSADAWLRDVASEVTVQIIPKDGVDTDRTIQEVAGFLTRQPGIDSTRTLSAQSSKDLLEPWLGKTDALDALPVPRLIAVQLNRSSPPNFESLSSELSRRFEGVSLDDHRQWQRQIKTVTRSLALGGIGILILVALATTAIIVSATRSAMASNREIVEVLHFVGATDGFIAREFEKHFLRLGIRAGFYGAISAMATFFIMPIVTLILGGGSMTEIELSRLVGTGHLDAAGYVLLGIVVVVVAALCMLTSRFGVYRILNSSSE